MPASQLISAEVKQQPGALAELFGGRSRECAMQLIQLGQQMPVNIGVLACKAIACTGAGLQLTLSEPGFGQALHLDP